jgi:hypothetical protein
LISEEVKQILSNTLKLTYLLRKEKHSVVLAGLVTILVLLILIVEIEQNHQKANTSWKTDRKCSKTTSKSSFIVWKQGIERKTNCIQEFGYRGTN